jgi:hypothetical protein
MNTSLCTVQFVGGPSDGLVLYDPDFKVRDKLELPARPAFEILGETRWCELVGHWSTAYMLTARQRTLEDGYPTTHLRYDFRGYELAEAQAARNPYHEGAALWTIALRSRVSEYGRRFVRWILEPVDFPLKVPHERQNRGRC